MDAINPNLPEWLPGIPGYLLPDKKELPAYIQVIDPATGKPRNLYGALRVMPYTFQAVAQLAMVEQSLDFHWPFLATSLTGVSSDAAGFRVMFNHTHKVPDPDYSGQIKSVTSALLNKHAVQQNVLGNATRQNFLPSPYLIMPGDSVMCEVRNLAPAANPVTTIIQVCIHGTEYSPDVKQT